MSTTDSLGEAGLVVTNYVPGVTGHVVVERGCDSSGIDSVALWHVDAAGQPVGAWIVGTESLAEDPVAAQRLFGLTHRRAVLCWDTCTAADVLEKLAKWAGAMPPPGWGQNVVRLPDAVAEIAQQRRQHTDAVDAYRTSHRRSKVLPLVWRTDVPEGVTSPEEMRVAAKLATPLAECEVAGRALLVVHLTRWVVQLWQETETTRQRRRYLRDQFGAEAPLPPGWLARLRAADTASTVR